MNRIAGVYEIRNIMNGHKYIGSSVNVPRRWAEHKRKLNANEHHSIALQRAWNKYGADNFTFEILEEVADKISCVSREQAWLDKCTPEYNIAPNANTPGGCVVSAETRKKLSESGKRLAQNPEYASKMRQILLTKAVPAAARRVRTEADHERSVKHYQDVYDLIHARHEIICDQCGKMFIAEKGRFCSNNCKSQWRRDNGLDNEVRTCKVCGKEFITSKYSKAVTCSKTCSGSRWIVGIDSTGQIVCRFRNALEASKNVGVDNSTISRAIKGKYHTAGGFIWRYADEAVA